MTDAEFRIERADESTRPASPERTARALPVDAAARGLRVPRRGRARLGLHAGAAHFGSSRSAAPGCRGRRAPGDAGPATAPSASARRCRAACRRAPSVPCSPSKVMRCAAGGMSGSIANTLPSRGLVMPKRRAPSTSRGRALQRVRCRRGRPRRAPAPCRYRTPTRSRVTPAGGRRLRGSRPCAARSRAHARPARRR